MAHWFCPSSLSLPILSHLNFRDPPTLEPNLPKTNQVELLPPLSTYLDGLTSFSLYYAPSSRQHVFSGVPGVPQVCWFTVFAAEIPLMAGLK